jgi:hypothetical protein
LKAFVDFFLLGNGQYDNNRLLWITDHAFVCSSRYGLLPEELPGTYRYAHLELQLARGITLLICSSTLQEAMPALDLLFGLRDHHFDEMILRNRATGNERTNRRCPLTNHLLEKMLVQSSKRMSKFYHMDFTPGQGRILAASGTRTNIELYDCNFEDDGAAFLEALVARDDQDAGHAKLVIRECLPFHEYIFVLCLKQLNRVCLELYDIALESERTCRALATAEVHDLQICQCKFEDEGAALVESLTESIRAERGPKGLRLKGEHPKYSSGSFNEFANALRGNSYLERLDLSYLDVGKRLEERLEALVDALSANEGLVHLGLRHSFVDDGCWNNLVRAVSKHPTLLTLTFENIIDNKNCGFLKRRDRINALAGMLSENEQVEDIQLKERFFTDTYDRVIWDELVVPRLECNVYRKRFVVIQRIQNPKTRAAVMTRALAHVKSKSSLLYMLLSHNHDIVSSYRSEALTRTNFSPL